MKTNDKKLYFSYRESKNTIFNEKQEQSNNFIKRTEKRHKTQTGTIPKNFQFIIKSKIKNEKEEEKIINDKKYDSKTLNISNLIDSNKLRKNKSTIILPSINKYNLNNNTNIFESKINNNIYNSNTTIPPKISGQKESNPIKKAKSQIISRANLINNNRHNPNFPKYERRMSDKFITIQPKKKEEPKPKEKNEIIVPKDEKIVKTSSTRRRSLGGGIRRFVKKESQVRKEFKNITYVKTSKATSEAGLDDGIKKINQDVYIHEKNINGILNFNIFGVLDGHGDFGHLASNFTKRYILNKITNHPRIKILKNNKKIYNELIKNNHQLITNIFLDADTQIKKEKFDCEMSGTTCVIVIQLDENLICANTGDSRAILVYDESQSNNLKNSKVFPLSHDAKPDLPREKERIIKCGGEVEKMVDEKGLGVGPFRVWAKGKSYPGLAMSRSIGDMDAKLVGVIPNPEFIEYKIDSKAKYIIVCSDGIWEFLSNEEVMKIANSFYLRNDPFGLCQNLTNRSIDFWLKDDNYVDDITVVAVFF